jgi:hypothetical protein
MKSQADLYHDLPSVDELLRMSAIAALVAQEGQTAVAHACRTVLGRLRTEIGAGHLDAKRLALALSGTVAAIHDELRRARQA